MSTIVMPSPDAGLLAQAPVIVAALRRALPHDAVLSDLSPNISGIAGVDQARALELSLSALEFCGRNLKPDGVFVAKAFQGEAFDELVARLKREFTKVKVFKPTASRGESSETYVVSRGLLCSAKTA